MSNDKGYQVLDPLTGGLFFSPKLKVLNPIVATDSVFVVDILKRFKVSTNMFFHHKPMLKDVVVSPSIWMPLAYLSNVSGHILGKTLPLVMVFSEVTLRPFVRAFSRAETFLRAAFVYVVVGPLKFISAKFAFECFPFSLPSRVGFHDEVFCSPWSVALSVAEEVLRVIRSVFIDIESATAVGTFNFHHSVSIAEIQG